MNDHISKNQNLSTDHLRTGKKYEIHLINWLLSTLYPLPLSTSPQGILTNHKPVRSSPMEVGHSGRQLAVDLSSKAARLEGRKSHPFSSPLP